VTWDLILTVIRVYFMMVVPLQLAFSYEFLYSSSLYYVTLISAWFLMADLVMSFNTPYYEFGQLVTQRKRIATNTVLKGFGLEVASVFYINLQFLWPLSEWKDIGLICFIVQIQNVTKILRQCEEVLNLSKKQTSILELAKLICLVVYILHLFSCLWFWVHAHT
jgi:hypothetical protein